MARVEPRPLTAAERAVVTRMLALAREWPPPLPVALDSLRVVGRCDCGCASVDLASADLASVDLVPDVAERVVIADAYGTTASGVDVGVILWACGARLTGVEVYALAADTPELPTPESLTLDGGA